MGYPAASSASRSSRAASALPTPPRIAETTATPSTPCVAMTSAAFARWIPPMATAAPGALVVEFNPPEDNGRASPTSYLVALEPDNDIYRVNCEAAAACTYAAANPYAGPPRAAFF